MSAAAAASAPRSGLTPRRLAVLVPVVVGGGVALVLAARSLTLAPPHGPHALFGVLLLLVLAGIAQWRPLPLRDFYVLQEKR